MKVATRRRVFWLLMALYGAAILAWPLMSYGAIFAFDDPNGNRALAWYIAASIWLYPAFVVIGFVWGHYSRNTHMLPLVLKASVPLLSAIWVFLLPAIPALAISWLKEPSLAAVQQRREAVQAQLDPIYADRVVAIRARDALADVREAIRRGDVALLPHVPHTDQYIGVDGPPRGDAEPNHRVIQGSEFLGSIVALLADDPAHPTSRQGDVVRADYTIYWTPVFQEYIAARRDYMTRFNTTMLRHIDATR